MMGTMMTAELSCDTIPLRLISVSGSPGPLALAGIYVNIMRIGLVASKVLTSDLKRWWFERRQCTIDIPCEHEGAAVVLCQAISSAAGR